MVIVLCLAVVDATVAVHTDPTADARSTAYLVREHLRAAKLSRRQAAAVDLGADVDKLCVSDHSRVFSSGTAASSGSSCHPKRLWADAADDARGVLWWRGSSCIPSGDLQQHIESQSGITLDAAAVTLARLGDPCGRRLRETLMALWRSSTVAREYSFLLNGFRCAGWQPAASEHPRSLTSANVPMGACGQLCPTRDACGLQERRGAARGEAKRKRLAIVGWLHRHVEPVAEDEDDESLLVCLRAPSWSTIGHRART